MIYAYLMLLSFAGPFALSFDRKVSYKNSFSSVFFSSLIIAIPFLIWDYYFTQWGIWGFNEEYLIGINFFNLPVEEVSFFFVIPFCCLFIYEVLRAYFRPNPSEKVVQFFVLISALISIYLIISFHNKLYTLWAVSVFLFLLLFGYLYFRDILGEFILTYFVCIIPFLLVNGVLTGFFTAEPIVWYNNSENIALRIGSIPIDDLFYNFDLLFANLLIYKSLKKQ